MTQGNNEATDLSQFKAPDVFISYAREDQDKVRILGCALRERGRQAWVDWDSIHPSSEWSAEIEKGIRSAASFIFVVSSDSVASVVCRRELATAVELNKRIIPIICRQVTRQDVPEEIARRQWIFMGDQDDMGAAMEQLVQALDVDLQWLHRHNALLGQALAWEDADRENSQLLKGKALRRAEAWLADGAGKEPPPAQIHLTFVQASRRRASKVLRRITAGAVMGMLLAVGLSIWAIVASFAAQKARDLAIARQLNNRAELAGSERAELIELSALLAIESYRLSPYKNMVTDIPLRRAVSLLPKAKAVWDNPDTSVIDAVILSPESVAFALSRPGDDALVVAHTKNSSGDDKRVAVAAAVAELDACSAGKMLAVRIRGSGVILYETSNLAIRTIISRNTNSTAVLCDDQSNMLIVGWQDGVVSRYAADSGDHLMDMKSGLGTAVGSLALETDKQLVAAGSFHPDSFNLLDCPPVSDRLTAPGILNRLTVWSLTTGKFLFTSPHCRPVESMDFDPLEDRIASASDSGVYLWSLADGSLRARLKHQTNVVSVAFHPKESRLVSSSGRAAYVWNLSAKRREGQLKHQGPVTSARFSTEGGRILTASNDHTARLWRTSDGTEILRIAHYRDRVLPGDNPYFRSSLFHPDGETMLTAARDGRVGLWTSSLPLQSESVSASNIDLLAANNARSSPVWSSSGRYFVRRVGNYDWELRQLPGNRLIKSFKSKHQLLALAVSDKGGLMAASDFAGQILVLDIHKQSKPRLLDLSCDVRANQLPPNEQCFADTLTFDAKGEFLLTGSRNGAVFYWSIEAFEPLWQRIDQGNIIMSSAVSSGGDTVATGGTDRIVRIREVRTGELISEFQHLHDVKDLAFSPTGTQLASASADSVVRVFDLSTNRPIGYLQHRYPVVSVDYNAAGDRLVTGSTDNTVRIWDVASSIELSRIELQNTVVRTSFLTDDELLVVDTKLATVHPVTKEALVELACDRLTRNLDSLEWLENMGSVEPRATCPSLPSPR